MAIDEWSTTASANASGVTGVNFAEGQAPSTVNDSCRAIMADAATWYGQAKKPEYLTSVSGTNTITAAGPSALASLSAGQRFTLLPANTNTGATTLNITPSGGSALTAKSIFWNGAACVGGEIRQNIPITVFYDGTQFHIIANGFTAPFLDTFPIVEGSSDSTKKARLEADGITTATTRVLTVADADIKLMGHATGLTAARIPYATGATGGVVTDSANLSFDGTVLTVTGITDVVASKGVSAKTAVTGGTMAGVHMDYGAIAANTGRVVAYDFGGSTYKVLYLDALDLILNANGTGTIKMPAIGTTASAANLFVNTGSSPANDVLRSTSSLRYKTNVESVDPARSDAVLTLRPIWYRSLCDADRKDWSWYGLGAEDVAQVDPRLVQWTYRDWNKVLRVEEVPEHEEDGILVPTRAAIYESVPDTNSPMIPEAVMYDRVAILLLDVVKRMDARIKALEAKA